MPVASRTHAQKTNRTTPIFSVHQVARKLCSFLGRARVMTGALLSQWICDGSEVPVFFVCVFCEFPFDCALFYRVVRKVFSFLLRLGNRIKLNGGVVELCILSDFGVCCFWAKEAFCQEL